MAYAIRPFRADDAPALADLTLDAIRAVGSAKYTPEQVEAWAARHPGPDRFLERFRNGATIIVAADADDHAVAYTLLEPNGHLDMLYCHPEHTRRGLADQLLVQAEQAARAAGIERLYTEASELARPAFERAGYTALNRRDFAISHDRQDGTRSVPIHNYAMEKCLA
ncbi:GNAT family N-acetyltransferase [Erythrobacter sp. JK5]|uniref:GNAT family N-acetyltransferase n=1 Tax=Erythrobacter sp. JK5 TaxID=2829500 RepID=UPI001BABFEC0|nr:GNAT family N-acetyltransferase [Erythrobacter sp. JK5]QUL38793.1 GNAT family N-acetyltransferase [Erythrobacter sp. JK5]